MKHMKALKYVGKVGVVPGCLNKLCSDPAVRLLAVMFFLPHLLMFVQGAISWACGRGISARAHARSQIVVAPPPKAEKFDRLVLEAVFGC